MAFAVLRLRGFSYSPADDPDFVEWSVYMYHRLHDANTTVTTYPVSFHKCTEEDFGHFYPTIPSDKDRFEQYKE